jgi:ribosomal protein S6--L-glutamate ligase
MGQDIVLQEYIRESKGRDIRAIVVGRRVVAVMRRTAKAGEFRSNLHRGGLGLKVKLDRRYSSAAVAASHVMGLEVAGVDMLEGSSGPKILEINSSPGLEGIERASGVDVASAIVEHAENFVTRYKKTRRRSANDQYADSIDQERTLVRARTSRSGRSDR